ncbi:hypothetical protein PG985_015453 [Apiospora marii]|uniref:uncharacterized protein n=1 Tax=Apiospora marii TaxID=335849 RepID=UPI003131D6F1
MKRRQSSFPVLRFAAAAFVAASTTVHAKSDKGAADDESETADLEDNDISEVDQEPNELWENESGIVYGGFGWRHDKRGGEGGGGGAPAGGGSRGGPGGIIVLPPPYISGGHYPKTSGGAGRSRPFGFLRG